MTRKAHAEHLRRMRRMRLGRLGVLIFLGSIFASALYALRWTLYLPH